MNLSPSNCFVFSARAHREHRRVDRGQWLKLSARADGSFTITNARTGSTQPHVALQPLSVHHNHFELLSHDYGGWMRKECARWKRTQRDVAELAYCGYRVRREDCAAGGPSARNACVIRSFIPCNVVFADR